jgi:hypothetical protein
MVAFDYRAVTSQVEVTFNEAVGDVADLKAEEVRKAVSQVAETLFKDMAAAMGGETPSEINMEWGDLSERWRNQKGSRHLKQGAKPSGGKNQFYWGISSKSTSLRNWLGKRSVKRSFGKPTVKFTRAKAGQHRLEIDIFPKVKGLATPGTALAALKAAARGGASKQVNKFERSSKERPFLQPFMLHRATVVLNQKIEAIL